MRQNIIDRTFEHYVKILPTKPSADLHVEMWPDFRIEVKPKSLPYPIHASFEPHHLALEIAKLPVDELPCGRIYLSEKFQSSVPGLLKELKARVVDPGPQVANKAGQPPPPGGDSGRR